MSKFHILVSLIILILATSGESTHNTNTPINIRVYLHGFLSGPNATVSEVARVPVTGTSPALFASVRVGSDVMTSGPDMSTGTLGWAEFHVAFTGRTEGVALLQLEFLFKAGTYNGSSISVSGWNVLGNLTQEVPITGGTGQFRMARGYALSYAYSYDPVADYIVYLYDLYVYQLDRKGIVDFCSDI